jgi:glycerophosphoryl diester phosphodiesterase
LHNFDLLGEKSVKRWILISVVLTALIITGCKKQTINIKPSNLNEILQAFHDPSSGRALVAAHRAMHIKYPENSLAAIQHAIDSGIDIIEIDIRRTNDGKLILMHDGTVDRTTDTEGKVEDFTYQQIRKMTLKRSDEDTLIHMIPSLEEALRLAQDHIMVDLDIKSASIKRLVNQVHKTQTADQALFFDRDFAVLDSVLLLDSTLMVMPRAKSADEVSGILKKYKPSVLHIDDSFFTEDVVNQIMAAGCRIWINALGLPDVQATAGFVEIGYEPLVTGGANIIQTDRPLLLMQFLQAKGSGD